MTLSIERDSANRPINRGCTVAWRYHSRGFYVAPDGNFSIGKLPTSLSAVAVRFRFRPNCNRIAPVKYVTAILLFVTSILAAEQQPTGLGAEIDRRAREIESKAVSWRRDIHQNPELSNREVRTSTLVADHLRKLGMEVRVEVAHTGVIGILRGRQPGPVVALRADMDALPIVEQTGLPFASKVKTTFAGQEVGVAHACGHDAHTAILMATAEVLAGMKDRFSGTVKFIFQPAEEGAPAGEQGGAKLMVEQGALENPKPAAIFALHTMAVMPTGTIAYKPNGAMASADILQIVVKGRATHGAMPWSGVDPIVVSSQIIMALQTITSRQIDPTTAPAIVTIGSIHGGVRNNMIPDEVQMLGTIRTLDPKVQQDIHQRIRKLVSGIAESSGATATTTITPSAPVTFNDPQLMDRMLPTMRRVVGDRNVVGVPASTISEDFAFYQQQIPGMYIFLGVTPVGTDTATAPANHSPLFTVDEAALSVGIRTLTNLALDFLSLEREKL